MPLLTYAIARPRLGDGLAQALDPARHPGRWDAVEGDAAKLISGITGLPVPDSADNAPEWTALPMVMLIQYFSAGFVSNQSPEYAGLTEKGYEKAMQILKLHKHAPATADRGIATLKHGQFNGEQGEWF